jgi:hypothetical protein
LAELPLEIVPQSYGKFPYWLSTAVIFYGCYFDLSGLYLRKMASSCIEALAALHIFGGFVQFLVCQFGCKETNSDICKKNVSLDEDF